MSLLPNPMSGTRPCFARCGSAAGALFHDHEAPRVLRRSSRGCSSRRRAAQGGCSNSAGWRSLRLLFRRLLIHQPTQPAVAHSTSVRFR